jgi:hypothetical protein
VKGFHLELSLRDGIEKLIGHASKEKSQVRMATPSPAAKPAPFPKPQKSQSKGEFLMTKAQLGAIISYLTKKHGGNVPEKGILTIASQACQDISLPDVADLTSDSYFASDSRPDEWISGTCASDRVTPQSALSG